jgi:hypothetical protein
MDEIRNQRLRHNEVLFREINDAREQLNAAGAESVLTFLCECSDPTCSERIRLQARRYDAIRRGENRFILRPGHEEPQIESIVEAHPDYEIVKKYAA